MFTITLNTELANAGNLDSYQLPAYAPSSNAFLAVFVFASNTAVVGSLSGGPQWAERVTLSHLNTHRISLFTAQSGASPGSISPTFSCAGDVASGCAIHAYQITSDAGLVNFRQAGIAEGSGANATISVSDSMQSNGAYITFLANPEIVSSPVVSGWTVGNFASYTPPAYRTGSFYKINGLTGTSVQWTNNAVDWAGILLEVRQGAAVADHYYKQRA